MVRYKIITTIREFMAKQYDIGPIGVWFIAARQMFNQSLAYVSLANIPMMVAVFWDTKARQAISQVLPGFTFWNFIVGIIIVGLLIMIFEYKICVPSGYVFSNRQAVKHDNPFWKEVIELKQIEQDNAKKIAHLEELLNDKWENHRD